VPARPTAAGLLEPPPPDIFPEPMRTIESDGIRLVNFADAETALALNAQYVARDFREPKLRDRQPGLQRRVGRQRPRPTTHRAVDRLAAVRKSPQARRAQPGVPVFPSA
jgi:hypothetical protein